MKKFIAFIAIVLALGTSIAQKTETTSNITTSEQSTTISALSQGKEDVIAEILSELYLDSDTTIDVVKQFETKMKEKIGQCLKIDMEETGKKVIQNAQEGKFKKIKLSFEKPSENKFKISGKEKRTYKKAYKKFKKTFVNNRKSTKLDVVLGDKNLQKKVDKVAKVMTRRFKKDIKKISK